MRDFENLAMLADRGKTTAGGRCAALPAALAVRHGGAVGFDGGGMMKE